MRSALALILTAALLVTGAMVALDLALVLGPGPTEPAPLPAVSAPADAQRLVGGFYDAANALLAGGPASALTAMVSPGVLIHEGGVTPVGGREALAGHIQALQRQGDLRLHLVQVIGDEFDLTALIEARAVATPVPAAGHDPDDALWRTIDRFRVEEGMIVAYWPGAIESRPLPPLPSLSVPVPPQDAAIALTRLELAPGATLRALAVPFPQLLLVEHGTVAVSRRASLAVARAGAARFDRLPAAPETAELLLGLGDAVLFPAQSGQEVANHGDDPVSFLSLLVASREALSGPKHNLDRDQLAAVAMHDPKRIGRPTAWATGVTSETLAVGNLPTKPRVAASGLTLSGGQLTLEPGGIERPGSLSLLTFGIVSSGTLDLASASPGSAHMATPAGAAGAPDASARLLRAGDVLVVARGAAVTLQNAGASRLDVTLIEVNAASPAPG